VQTNKKIVVRSVSFLTITALYVALLLGFSGAVDPVNSAYAYSPSADRVIEKSFDVRPGGLLHLDTRVGRVNIEGWDRNEVRLKIEVTGRERDIEDIEFYIESSEDGVTIKAEVPRSRSLFRDIGRRFNISYSIMVPYEYNVDVKTSGGSINLAKVEGDLTSRTSGGSVRGDEVSGRIEFITSGGGIHLNKVRGDVSGRTSGGSINVNGAYGVLDVRTSGGSIRLSDIDARVEARTSGGGINLGFVGENRGIELRTSGGSISVGLPADIRGTIDARTSGGRVSTDFPVTVQGSISGSSLEGTVNGGGEKILLRTSGGGIRINQI